MIRHAVEDAVRFAEDLGHPWAVVEAAAVGAEDEGHRRRLAREDPRVRAGVLGRISRLRRPSRARSTDGALGRPRHVALMGAWSQRTAMAIFNRLKASVVVRALSLAAMPAAPSISLPSSKA